MLPPSARAKKMAADVWLNCNHGDDDEVCNDCVARALDAEREACAKLSEQRDWYSTAAECSGECSDDIAKAIRALAEEEGA